MTKPLSSTVKTVDPKSVTIIGLDTGHTEYGVEITETAHPLYDPRINLAPAQTDEKCRNVKEFGVLEPIYLKKNGKEFEVVSGRQRVKQARLARLESIPAIILNSDYKELAVRNLISNANRTASHFLTDADNMAILKEQEKLSRKAISTVYGMTVGKVDRYLQVAKLTEQQRDFVLESGMSFSAAHAYKGQSAEAQKEIQKATVKVNTEDGTAEDETFLSVDGDAEEGELETKATAKKKVKKKVEKPKKVTTAAVRGKATKKTMRLRSEIVEEYDLLKNKSKQMIQKGKKSDVYMQRRVALAWVLGESDDSLAL